MICLPAGDLTPMIGEYVAEKTGMTLEPGTYQAFMVVNDQSDFVAGVVLTNYRKIDIELSCASETGTAWRPHVLRAIFTYIFGQLDCVRCTAVVLKGNKKIRSFIESLGFQLEGNIRLGYDGRRDALVYGLLRSECRYFGGLDGEEIRPERATATGPGSDGSGSIEVQHGRRDHAGEPEPDRSVHAARQSDVLAEQEP